MTTLPKLLRNDALVEYETPEEQTTGGLYIPERAQRIRNEFTKAKVLALGPDCYGLAVGSRVLVEGHLSGFKIEDYYVVSSDHIYGTIEEEEE